MDEEQLKEFQDRLLDLHKKLCRKTLFMNRRDSDYLIQIIEGMTNISTVEELEIFNKMCEVKH
jgi:hypothetical protein